MTQFEWTAESEEKFTELFAKLEKDGTGSLTFNEIKESWLKEGAVVFGQEATDAEINEFIESVDRDGFEEVFQELDSDGSGALTFDEIKEGSLKKGAQLMGQNPSDAEVYKFVTTLDIDGDGKITKDEFRSFLQELLKQLLMASRDPKSNLEEAVDVMMNAIDKDGNGLCSKEEFKKFVQEKGDTPLTDEEVEELFSAIDSDGDKSSLNRKELLDVLGIGMYHSQ